MLSQCEVKGDRVAVVSVLKSEHKYTYFLTCDDEGCEPHNSYYAHKVKIEKVIRGNVGAGIVNVAVNELGFERSRLEGLNKQSVVVSFEEIDDIEFENRVDAKFILIDHCVSPAGE